MGVSVPVPFFNGLLTVNCTANIKIHRGLSSGWQPKTAKKGEKVEVYAARKVVTTGEVNCQRFRPDVPERGCQSRWTRSPG